MQYKYSTPPFMNPRKANKHYKVQDKLYKGLIELVKDVKKLENSETRFIQICPLDSKLEVPDLEKKIWRLNRLVKSFDQQFEFIEKKLTAKYISHWHSSYSSIFIELSSYIVWIQGQNIIGKPTSTYDKQIRDHITTVENKTLKQFDNIESYENRLQFILNKLVEHFQELETYYFELKTDISKIRLEIQRNNWKKEDQISQIENGKPADPNSNRALLFSKLIDLAYPYLFCLFDSINEDEESSEEKNEDSSKYKDANTILKALILIGKQKSNSYKVQWQQGIQFLRLKNRIEDMQNVNQTSLENQFSYFLPRLIRLYQLYKLNASDLMQELNKQKEEDIKFIYPIFYENLEKFGKNRKDDEVNEYIRQIDSSQFILETEFQLESPLPIVFDSSSSKLKSELKNLLKQEKISKISAILPKLDRKKLVKFANYTNKHKHILYNTTPLVASPSSYIVKQINQQNFKIKQDKKTDRKLEARFSFTNFGSTSQTNTHDDSIESPTVTIIYEPKLIHELSETTHYLNLLVKELTYVQDLLNKLRDWHDKSKVQLSENYIANLDKLPSSLIYYKTTFSILQTLVNDFDGNISEEQGKYIINNLLIQLNYMKKDTSV